MVIQFRQFARTTQSPTSLQRSSARAMSFELAHGPTLRCDSCHAWHLRKPGAFAREPTPSSRKRIHLLLGYRRTDQIVSGRASRCGRSRNTCITGIPTPSWTDIETGTVHSLQTANRVYHHKQTPHGNRCPRAERERVKYAQWNFQTHALYLRYSYGFY